MGTRREDRAFSASFQPLRREIRSLISLYSQRKSKVRRASRGLERERGGETSPGGRGDVVHVQPALLGNDLLEGARRTQATGSAAGHGMRQGRCTCTLEATSSQAAWSRSARPSYSCSRALMRAAACGRMKRGKQSDAQAGKRGRRRSLACGRRALEVSISSLVP